MKQKLVIIATVVMLALSTAPAGAQWVRTNWPFDSNAAPTCFAVSGKNLYAGTAWSGVYRSSDSGVTWSSESSGLIARNYIYALAIIDTNLSMPILLAGTDYGVFVSTNNGTNWTSANNGLTGGAVLALAVIGTNLFAGTDTGLFRSVDNGASWTAVINGLPKNSGVNVYAMDTYLYVVTDSGLYRSNDNGTSWTNIGLPVPPLTAFTSIGTTLFVGTDSGVYRSTNNGVSWAQTNTGLISGGVELFAVFGTDLFAVSSGYIFLSVDNGASWKDVGWNQSGWGTSDVSSLGVSGTDLFAGTTLNYDVLRRPLSQMINHSAVAATPPTQNSITAYPNPFSQSTTISFSSPESGVVEVTIVNLLGTEVKRIFSGEIEAGHQHSFAWDAGGMPPGMYECVVRVNGKAERIPIVLER